MTPEHDDYLCNKYPKIFQNRHADMRTTCMCWGFECGDGWFNLIDGLCSTIQGHIDWRTRDVERDVSFNQALQLALDGNQQALLDHYSAGSPVADWMTKTVAQNLEKPVFRTPDQPIPQVVAVQVKEKFGGLRFYYDGGDELIRGAVSMAEAMSYRTCDVCGAPGTPNHDGWISTRCEAHRE